ncbi:hypothetical protein V6N11_068086 [Hibiscus sabdariffa]|uniref:Uncharacterized protein n=1 Tax=Hibiscus sabdariffa TaxID=183260 RepID=A0ABR2STL1_9ROSI
MPGSVNSHAGKGPPITYGNLLKDEVTSPHPFRSTSLPVLSHNGVKKRVFVDSCPTHSVEMDESLRHVTQATEVGGTTTAADASLNIQLPPVINRVENMPSAGFDELGTPSQQQRCPSIILPVANIQHELSQVGNSQQDAQAYDSSQQNIFQPDATDADPQGVNSAGGPSTSHFEDALPSQILDTFISHADASSSHENTVYRMNLAIAECRENVEITIGVS